MAKFVLARFEQCPAVEPVAVRQCEQAANHEMDHWYTVWARSTIVSEDGLTWESHPGYPVFWANEQVIA